MLKIWTRYIHIETLRSSKSRDKYIKLISKSEFWHFHLNLFFRHFVFSNLLSSFSQFSYFSVYSLFWIKNEFEKYMKNMNDFMWSRCWMKLTYEKCKWWIFENTKIININNKKYWIMFSHDSKKRMNNFHMIQTLTINNE